MAKRSEAQVIGSRGQSLVANIINATGSWIPRLQNEDFGIDLEAELSVPEVAGQLLKVQVKTSQTAKIRGDHVVCDVPRSLVFYADSCRVPVIFVQAGLEQNEAWYFWVQQWLLNRRRSGGRLSDLAHQTRYRIPLEQTLSCGLNGELASIAKWQTETQLLLTVNDAIRTAASVQNLNVLNHLVGLLETLDLVDESFPINLVVEQAVSLGSALRGTYEGLQASSTLCAICRRFGKDFTADQVWRMVAREESYSRTGIIALGILYDDFFDHTAQLGLVDLFMKHPDLRVAFYCKLREKNPHQNFFECLERSGEFQFAGFAIDPALDDELMSNWPNRGDSVLLDYLNRVS